MYMYIHMHVAIYIDRVMKCNLSHFIFILCCNRGVSQSVDSPAILYFDQH